MKTKGEGYVLAAKSYLSFEEFTTTGAYTQLLREGAIKWIQSGAEFDLNFHEGKYVEAFDGNDFIWFRKEDIELEEGEAYDEA